MKKLKTIVVASLMVVLLAGCGKTNEKTTDSSKEKEVTVNTEAPIKITDIEAKVKAVTAVKDAENIEKDHYLAKVDMTVKNKKDTDVAVNASDFYIEYGKDNKKVKPYNYKEGLSEKLEPEQEKDATVYFLLPTDTKSFQLIFNPFKTEPLKLGEQKVVE